MRRHNNTERAGAADGYVGAGNGRAADAGDKRGGLESLPADTDDVRLTRDASLAHEDMR